MRKNNFPIAPSISIPRSRWSPKPIDHPLTMMHGKLVPVYCMEVVAGDGFKVALKSLIRMSTPKYPFLGNIKAYANVFFVPYRLLWKHWEEFFGVNKDTAGPQTRTFTVPTVKDLGTGVISDIVSDFNTADYTHSLADYLLGTHMNATAINNVLKDVSLLPFAAYYLIWSYYYRAIQVQDPFVLDDEYNGKIGSIGTNDIGFDNTNVAISCLDSSDLLSVCKIPDLFTNCTLQPQYGTQATIPLGDYAPIITRNNVVANPGIGMQVADINNTLLPGNRPLFAQNGVVNIDTGNSHSWTQKAVVYPSNLWADLRNATAANINELFKAFALQRYLWKDNFMGGRGYHDLLRIHYGVFNPDGRLQYPEHLGGAEWDLVVSQVLSQSAAGPNAGQDYLAAPGATSTTYNDDLVVSKAFTEPGILMILVDTKHERFYSSGIDRHFLKADRFDYYTPEFANLGDDVVDRRLLFSQGVASNFGYQEYGFEYRYFRSFASGCLNPNNSGFMPGWILDVASSSAPALNSTFLTEDRNAIKQVLTTGDAGPDYICDFSINLTLTRPMPLHSVPGFTGKMTL